MAERPSGKEVRFIQNNRVFVQFGGSLPNIDTRYYGQDMNYAIMQGVNRSTNGQTTPHWTGDPNLTGQYRLIGVTTAAPALDTFTLNMMEKRGTINRLFAQDCGFTAYVNSGDCGDISSFLYGWSDKIEIYPDAIIGTVNGGNRGDWATDGPIINQVPGTTRRKTYEVGSLSFGSILGADIAVEVVDAVYGNLARCGNCGAQNNGTNWQYAVMIHSASNEAAVLYRITDASGAEITTGVVDIDGIGATADPTAIEIVGDKLVVLVTSELAYYYATINQATGVPGVFTKVTTGFVASKQPTDILAYSDREVFFSGNGGYVYKSSDITAGVSPLTSGGATVDNLLRIHGLGDTIVAVGANGVVLVSTTRGIAWFLTDDIPAASTLTGVDVRDRARYWVTTTAGELWYTLDGGATWHEKGLSDSPATLRDVRFATDEVGWVTGATAAPAGLIYATFNGGRDWTTHAAAPRMVGVPGATAFQRGDRIAVPTAGNDTVVANNLLVAGLGATTDGILLQATGNFF